MSGSLGSLHINLDLNSVQFSQGLSKAHQQAQRFAKTTQRDLAALEKSVANIASAVNVNKLDILAKYGFILGRSALRAAEDYTSLKNKMALLTDSQQKQATAMAIIFDISQRTNQAMGATSDVYARFASNADKLGLSQRQVASLTETVSKAVAMSGASAADAERGLTQFGQALATGALKGQDLNSIMQQIPGLADAIAKGLGVTTGELKEMGAKGELSIQKVVGALQKARSAVDNDFDKRLKTISGSFTNLQNSFTKFIGEADQAYGITQQIAEGIEFVAQNLDSAIRIATLFVGALSIAHLGKYTFGLVQTGIASAKNIQLHRQEAQAIYTKATAMREAAQVRLATLQQYQSMVRDGQRYARLQQEIATQTAIVTDLTNAEAVAKRNLSVANKLATTAAQGLKNIMGLLGGPVGVITLAGGALWYFSEQAEAARQKALDTAGANERLKESYEGLSAAALSLKISKQLEELENYQEQIHKLNFDIASLEQTWHISGLSVPESVRAEISELTDKISILKQNANIDFSVLENQLEALARAMLQSGKSIDEIRDKFKLLGIDSAETEWILGGIPSVLDDVANSSATTESKVLDLAEAQKKLNEKSQTMKQRLEVLTLKSQGNAKASFVLAGLYEILGEEGAKYAEVLKAIATGQTVSAESAKNLSAEMLNQLKTMAAQLEGVFADSEQVHTIEQNFKTQSSGKSKKDLRKEWESYYNELQRANADAVQSIALNEQRSIAELEKHLKTGVVKQHEAEMARTQIAQRYAKERAELVGRYVEKDQIKFHLDKSLSELDGLKQLGLIGSGDAKEAEMRLRLKYSQDISQYAVSAKDQVKGIYDPSQAELNRQTQELAQLQSFNEQKLMTEEEYQQRKQAIIERYKNEQWQKEMNSYTQGLNDLGGAFDTLAGVVERSAGKQSTAYKAMFALSKGFAIAEASIKLSQAIAQALADPTALTPAQKFANMASVAAAGANLVAQISSVGFATGGYTGDGGKFTPAGIVHKGEYVITKEATSRIGLDYLNYLNYGRRGFANGGGVAVPRVPSINHQLANNGETHNSVTVTVNIDKNGNAESNVEQQAQQGKQLGNLIQAKVLEVLSRERRAGGMLAH